MNATLADYLNSIEANDETIETAARMVLAELSEDKGPSEMTAALQGATTNAAELSKLLTDLEESPQMRVEFMLTYLALVWPDHSERVKAALRAAQRKLPVIESALLALVAVYGLYTIPFIVRPVGKEIRRVARDEKGNIREETETVYKSPASPLGLFKDIFAGLLGQSLPGEE